MHKLIEARVAYATSLTRGDRNLRYMEDTLVLNYVGVWYSALDILDMCVYHKIKYPSHLVSDKGLSDSMMLDYFGFMKGYIDAATCSM